MTKQHYWYIFGKIDIPNYNAKHQELNRWTVDPSWIELAQNLPKSDYTYRKDLVYELVDSVRIENGNLFLTELTVLDKLQSDEGMLEVQICYRTKDSTKSAVLMFETFTEYKWNWYNGSPIEPSIGQPENEELDRTYYVNIQRMRHDNDEVKIYFNAPSGASIDVKSLQIFGHTIQSK